MDMGGGIGRVTKHPEYYLSDGSVSFLSKDRTLFRVHKSFFERESAFFRNHFETSTQEDPQSGTDARPFTLDSVTSDEFATLLWVWYDRDYAYHEQTKDGWTTILNLSKRWGFEKIKDLAIRELDELQLSPAERVSLYNEHGVEGDRLVSSYVELCKSPRITEADGKLLQMETLINILEARESAQQAASKKGHQSPTSASLADEDLREIVTRFFRTSSTPRSSGTSTGPGDQASDLNGEPTHGTGTKATTIILGEPPVPDRKPQTTSSGIPPHTTESSQSSSKEGSQEEGKRKEAVSKAEKLKEERERQAREKKEAQEKLKEEKERMAKELREQKEREKKGQKPPATSHNQS